MPYVAFLLLSNFCVSKIGLTAIRKQHLECRYQCASTFFRQKLISIDSAGNLFCCSLLPKGAAEGVARAGAVPGAASDAGDKGRCRVYISPYYRTGQNDKGRLR